jgi:hypothetical protein
MDTPITATITDYTPPTDESPRLIADGIKEQVATLEAQVNTLRDTIARERANVRDLYTQINDLIEENECDPESTLTYDELSDILAGIFGNALSFQKEYQAWVEFKVRVTVDYKSTSQEDAQSVADSIELSLDDADISYDGEAEVSEIYVESTRVLSVEEQ